MLMIRRTAAVLIAALAAFHLCGALQIVQEMSAAHGANIPLFGVYRGYDEPLSAALQAMACMAVTWFALAYVLRVLAEGLWKGWNWAPGTSVVVLSLLILLRFGMLRSNSQAHAEGWTVLFFCGAALTTALLSCLAPTLRPAGRPSGSGAC
jgi:hypothetical protein